MSFYIGQRVRLRYIRSSFHPSWRAGAEGVITNAWITCLSDVPGDWCVRVTGSEGVALSEQLEPIAPPGLESLEEINALYEPSPVEVRA